jgi:hypothetical protein
MIFIYKDVRRIQKYMKEYQIKLIKEIKKKKKKKKKERNKEEAFDLSYSIMYPKLPF